MTFRPMIETAARGFRLDPDLVHAVVLKESSGNSWAWNPEPHYRYLWNVATHEPFRPLTYGERAAEVPPKDFPYLAGDRDQEWWGQQASWGLMQVMGAVGRELGFRGPYLAELCDPETNLWLGCGALALAQKWANGDVRKALASYNGGRGNWQAAAPQAYAASVLAIRQKVRSA